MARRDRSSEPIDEPGDPLMKFIAAKLREARTKSGLTQSQVGAKAGFPQQYVFELETGTTNPTALTLAKMAEALGMEIRDLFPESSRGPPTQLSPHRLQDALRRMSTMVDEQHKQNQSMLIDLAQCLVQDSSHQSD